MTLPSEINSYGTHFYDIKTIVDNPQPCEIEITINIKLNNKKIVFLLTLYL